MRADKVAVVTGAGSGVGRCVALRLAMTGYRVALVGRTPVRLEQTGSLIDPPERWLAIPADVTLDEDRHRIVRRTLEAFGRIDALVSNAGAVERHPFRDHTAHDLRRVFDVNAIGPIDLAARCVRAMGPEGGAVVFTSSLAAVDPFPGLGVYGCAKAALHAACRALAREESDRGIRAYAVAPGAIETDMLRGLWDESALPRDRTLSPDAVAERIAACVTGETAARSGETIYLPSPG